MIWTCVEMPDYIKREDVLNVLKKYPTGTWRGVPVYSDEMKSAMAEIANFPAADVVSREEYERMKWERDLAFKALLWRWKFLKKG
ncbi:MAG TPA: hypothetical protein IAC31_09140 [Candidatus Faecousia intestinigallinarum]|nr:hypothetical protein [Candidatus Faecousia intestinigallinarum]